MKVGPDIARIASLLGDPARANMLTELMGGAALTAGELARVAGVAAQTASSHLAKLEKGGLVRLRRQGRHSYYSLFDSDVGVVLERLMGLAARAGHLRARPGPKEPALRLARVCYDHLAGELAVELLDGLIARGAIARTAEVLVVTEVGDALLGSFGIDPVRLTRARRPVCMDCLDWSVRRSHLAGSLGAVLLRRFYELGWASRVEGTRIVSFSESGRCQFAQAFGSAALP